MLPVCSVLFRCVARTNRSRSYAWTVRPGRLLDVNERLALDTRDADQGGYVLVTSAFNEKKYIEATILSVLSQTVLHSWPVYSEDFVGWIPHL